MAKIYFMNQICDDCHVITTARITLDKALDFDKFTTAFSNQLSTTRFLFELAFLCPADLV